MEHADSRNDATEAPHGPGARAFVTTRWSLVLSVRSTGAPEATQALELLCRDYWYPLYAHVRRLGVSPVEAEDLTQSFFARLLKKEWIHAATPERGRFRSFLLTSLQHFLSNEWDRARTQKRGGRFQFLSLNAASGEERWALEPATHLTPEREFDQRWAMALLETVLMRLQREYSENGKRDLFEHLKGAVSGEAPDRLASTAGPGLGMSAGAVRVAAHRLRKRYRELLREEIAQTVSNPSDVDQELRHLFAALSATTAG